MVLSYKEVDFSLELRRSTGIIFSSSIKKISKRKIHLNLQKEGFHSTREIFPDKKTLEIKRIENNLEFKKLINSENLKFITIGLDSRRNNTPKKLKKIEKREIRSNGLKKFTVVLKLKLLKHKTVRSVAVNYDPLVKKIVETKKYEISSLFLNTFYLKDQIRDVLQLKKRYKVKLADEENGIVAIVNDSICFYLNESKIKDTPLNKKYKLKILIPRKTRILNEIRKIENENSDMFK